MSKNKKFDGIQILETPILFLVFNRIDTTKKVFEAIQQAKPEKLYIACDGARLDKPGEIETVNNVRKYLNDNIDWKCEVKTLFQEQNKGCKYAVSTAISWFFENEEQGIILEDDCLPNSSFFKLAEELLIKYENDFRVGQISGFNSNSSSNLEYDYFFSKYPMIWGWATWKSRWENYNVEADLFDKVKEHKYFLNIFDSIEANLRYKNIESARSGKINTWDYQWSFACYINNYLTIIPNKNMIKNIGFNEEATHTKTKDPYINLHVFDDLKYIKHPEYFIRINEYENEKKGSFLFMKYMYGKIKIFFGMKS